MTTTRSTVTIATVGLLALTALLVVIMSPSESPASQSDGIDDSLELDFNDSLTTPSTQLSNRRRFSFKVGTAA